MSDNSLLDGLRVVELASDHTALAAKMLADYGAEVIVVEPPGGHASRGYEPFVDDERGPERSLHWWHYNTSKLGVSLDLDTELAVFDQLVASADIVLDGERPHGWASIGRTPMDFVESNPALIWVSVTGFGWNDPRSDEASVDLTLLAEGGPVWSCGYDDHTLPPVRASGGHAYATGGIWAVQAALAAVLDRDRSGLGQFIDVSIFAAANVTTEGGSFWWLVNEGTVERQTARHAATVPTISTMVTSKDDRPLLSGVPPRTSKQFGQLITWMKDCELYEQFDDHVLLEMGAEMADIGFHTIGNDALATEILTAGREALNFLGRNLTAYDFFLTGQQHGIAVGVIYAPEETLSDPHFVDRGFPTTVHHDDLGRDIVYPGAPFLAAEAPWRISRRAPHLGEHNDLLSPYRDAAARRA